MCEGHRHLDEVTGNLAGDGLHGQAWWSGPYFLSTRVKNAVRGGSRSGAVVTRAQRGVQKTKACGTGSSKQQTGPTDPTSAEMRESSSALRRLVAEKPPYKDGGGAQRYKRG